MFAGEVEAHNHKISCGPHWHNLFSTWERRQRQALNGEAGVQVIVWRCHEICGGLGDRQRGILTSFTLAIMTDRAFFIDSPHPVPLQHYFRVASPDLHWVFDEILLANRSVFEESFMDSFPGIGDYAHANLSFYDAYDVVIQKNNFWKPLSILQNPSLQSHKVLRSYPAHILAGCMLNYLLSPVIELQLAVQQMKSRSENIIAVQIRSGDSQAKNLTVLHDVVHHFQKCVNMVSQLSKSEYSVFLTTDSEEVKERFAQAGAALLTFDGPIAHVDGFFGLSHSPHLSFRKAVLDHMMISQSQQLVISRSGFAEFAALRGFKSYYTPPACAESDRIEHYEFPLDLQAGVPATQLNSVQDILRPSFEGRNDT